MRVRVGEVLRKWRLMSEVTTRDLAERIGISAATLSRVERGEAMDGATLAKILNWLFEATKQDVGTDS